MLSNSSKYAIRAVLYLVPNSNKQNKLGSKFLADALQVPEPFLAKLLQQLVRNKLLLSSKGPHGGFYISKDSAKKSTVCDIVEIIDGRAMFDTCFMGLDECSAANPCPLHHLVVIFKENIYSKFKDINLMEFAKDIEAKGLLLSLKSEN